jgi:hypothetical protein
MPFPARTGVEPGHSSPSPAAYTLREASAERLPADPGGRATTRIVRGAAWADRRQCRYHAKARALPGQARRCPWSTPERPSRFLTLRIETTGKGQALNELFLHDLNGCLKIDARREDGSSSDDALHSEPTQLLLFRLIQRSRADGHEQLRGCARGQLLDRRSQRRIGFRVVDHRQTVSPLTGAS